MKLAAYSQSQTVTLKGEAAFEELYARLARWIGEAESFQREQEFDSANLRIDRCAELLGYMNHAIDLSRNYEVAAAILSLHKFLIGALIKAKTEPEAGHLSGLGKVLITLTQTFEAMRTQKAT
ncbi:MAG TPA: flagellar protein FliS [Candidatus Binataceae bacterium]|nr:flagellar protein FliS [Candidatus Binataceae bacterium]